MCSIEHGLSTWQKRYNLLETEVPSSIFLFLLCAFDGFCILLIEHGLSELIKQKSPLNPESHFELGLKSMKKATQFRVASLSRYAQLNTA